MCLQMSRVSLRGTSKEKTMFILSKTGVASVPDDAFFHEPGDFQFVRFCFAKEDKELDEACRRLERLNSYIKTVSSRVVVGGKPK